MTTGFHVHAVIVTYHPDVGRLRNLVAALLPQVKAVTIVDNGSPPKFDAMLNFFATDALTVLRLGYNAGVAQGHNVGIAYVRQHGATHVILFDQDSLPAADMVECLLNAAGELKTSGIRVGAVGPLFHDPRDDVLYPFIRLAGGKIERIRRPDQNNVCFADYLITSGCLIGMDCLDVVGGMDDALFIDYVDIEWGLRAKAHGFQNVGVFNARMEHPLGEPPMILFGGRLRAPLHKPLRHYYHFRNALLLYRRSYAPWRWCLNDGYRLVLKFFFYSLMTSDRLQQLRMMVLGIWHGIRGRGGKLEISGG